MIKPLLKYTIRHKSKFNETFRYCPREMNNYHNILVGNGIILFNFINYVNNNNIIIKGDIYAYDTCYFIIAMYKNIQNYHIELFEILNDIIIKYENIKPTFDYNTDINNNIPKNKYDIILTREQYYLYIRNEFNSCSFDAKNTLIGSAMFIFLNRTCFRGNNNIRNQIFTCPYGNNNHTSIISKNDFEEIYQLIKNVKFECCNIHIAVSKIKDDDYYYVDII